MTNHLAVLFVASSIVPFACADDAMPVAQQNLIVQRYCAACHDDVKMVADFSLQHYDAANPDPGLTAMLLSKMKDGAFGASGIPVPDKPTTAALISALTTKAAGADKWATTTQTPVTTAGIVREAGSMYRLTLTCNEETRDGEVRVAWSSKDVPGAGGSMAVVADGKPPSTYRVPNGEGRAILRSTGLPEQTLTISDLFPGETVTFPLDGLAPAVRKSLSRCFDKAR